MSQKDFMSTQTGGAGETIQAQIPNIPQESQFQANIRPVPQPQLQETAMPPAMQETDVQAELPPVVDPNVDIPVQQISEEQKIYQDYGLNQLDVEIPEIIYAKQTKPEQLDVESNEPIVSDDGFNFIDPKDADEYFKSFGVKQPETIVEDTEPLIAESDDGFKLYNSLGIEKDNNNRISKEYEGSGINLDDKGNVKVADPKDKYPIYRLPGKDTNYQNREDGWYKEVSGKYVKLTEGNVEQRSDYLKNNAVVVSSSIGKGSKALNANAAVINQRFGDLRGIEDKSIITAGGDPVLTDGLSFSALTRSNIGSKSEPLNQDGTANFNYDPKTAAPNPFKNNNPVNEKPDGIYYYKGSASEYKKENGKWLVKPKGSTSFIDLKEGDIENRIANLEREAVKKMTISEAVTLTGKPLSPFNYDPDKLFNEPVNVEKAKLSYSEAQNFASKNIEQIVGDKLNADQKKALTEYQANINKIMSDNTIDETRKGILVSDVMKNAQGYFESAKQINKEINVATQNGVSLSKLALDNKKKIADAMLVQGGNPDSDFQKFTKEMFDASSEMADFFVDNLDSGKIRFDAESNQYVISNMVSERDRKFIEGKMNAYAEKYNQLQDKRYEDLNNEVLRYKRNLSAVDSNIEKIEQSLKSMGEAGIKSTDPARIALANQLDKEKKKREYINGLVNDAEKTKSAVFLTEPKKVAIDAAKNLSTDAYQILNAVPKDVSPKERFDLFYKGLYDETVRMMRDNGIGEDRFSGSVMALKDMLDWDGLFALNDVEKRVAKNIGTLRSLSPLYFNNDTGITESSAGFFNSFMNSFAQALMPTVAKADGFSVQTEKASDQLQVITNELEMNPDDFIDERFIEKLERRSVNSEWNREKWGGMTGTTVAIMAPIMLTAGVGPGALRLASRLEKMASIGLGAKETTGLVNGAVRVYDTVLDGTSIGRFLRPALESGMRFEIAGNVFGSSEDELYFLSGLAGGVASEALSGLMAQMPKDQILGYMESIFGGQTGRAVNYIKKVGDLSAKGVAETGEEFSQELSNIYRDTDSFKEMMNEVSNRFGSFDKIQEFVISSFILGAGFGIADGSAGKKAYDRLPENKRSQVDKVLAQITRDMNMAEEAVNEYVENKQTQVEIENSVRDDQKDEQGVSGQVGEGQELVEGQPDVEAGQEEAGPSGLVQEEQATPTEEKVTAMSADEAKNLWDQGYRPVIDGQQARGGKDMTIDNLFNTKKQVEMVRMVAPEPAAQPTATEPEAVVEPVEGAAPIEEVETIEAPAYQKLAEKIRSGKIDTRGGTMISIVPPQVLNAALEGVALTVETVGQVIEKIKESDWYKNLQDISKPIIDREIARSLNNLASKPVYTQQDAENEAYITEFKEIYDDLLYQVERNPSIANVNNLKAFTENPKQFIQDLVDTGEIKSGAYQVSYLAGEEGKTIDQYVSEKMSNADSVISSDSKTTANNIIARQHDVNWRNTDAPFIMSESVYITSNQEKAKADGVTDEQIKEAEEYLANPIKYHQEIYDLYSDNTKPYYNEEKAQKALRELNYVKSVYERYGVDTGLTAEQSQQIEQDAENLPPAPAQKKKSSRAKMTPEEKQAAADQRKAEREAEKARLKAEREAKKKADKEFGEKVAEVTGTKKAEKSVQMTELEAIKKQMKDKALGAKELQAVKDQVKKFINDNLPTGKDFEYTAADIKAVTRAVSSARGQESLSKAIEKVEALIEKKMATLDKKAEAKRKQTVKKIESLASSKKTLLSKRGNKWVGKVTTDAQKEFKEFVNSGALDNLDNKTQEELDAILDVMNGILGEGRADQKNKEAIENALKRQRQAKVIEGLASKEDKVKLNSIEEVKDWLDKGNLVVINGELFRKSSFAELNNRKTALEKEIKKKQAEAKKIEDLLYDPDFKAKYSELNAIENEIKLNETKESIADLEAALATISFEGGGSITGYKQRPVQAVKEAERSRLKKWYRSPKGILRMINPVNSINDIYSLLKSAYSGSSEVTKFIKQNIEKAIPKAYFERMKGYNAKINELNAIKKEIFGTRSKSYDVLATKPDVDLFSDRALADFPVTNGHAVDWYNLVRTNKNGVDRMEKSGVKPQQLIDYIESNPELKAYADALLNKYNSDLRKEYEPVYESYVNRPFEETTYYPAYAADFRESFVNEDDVLGVDGMYNAMNATSRNLKQRTSYSGPFDLRLDADAKYLDYVKTMEHAKHFLPIAKAANELFSQANSPYLVENMGIDNFVDVKQHLGVILSDSPLEEYKGRFSRGLNTIRRISTLAQLGFKLSSIPKQFTSFTHYWVAGIDRGIDPVSIMYANVPQNKEEANVMLDIIKSDYVRERLTGSGIDIEIKAIEQLANEGKISQAWKILSDVGMTPTKVGDISVIIGPGGGLAFSLAMYRKNIKSGMSKEEAFNDAYEAFVTETERAQQSSREDITSMVQRDPIFRTMAQFRTGQMAVTKKIVNGVKTLNQAAKIQNSEGAEKRREAISDREVVQAFVDIAYYTTLGSTLFSAVATGALYFWMQSDDDDEKTRMRYDLAMDQVQSLAQGGGWSGYLLDWVISEARGDAWKNNVPVITYLQGLVGVPADIQKYRTREWSKMTDRERLDYMESGSMEVPNGTAYRWEEYENFRDEFNESMMWTKMSDTEKKSLEKAIGGKNIALLIDNWSAFSEGEKDMFQALMNYDSEYFEKAKDKNKKDYIFELFMGEPYLIKDGNQKIKGGEPFPDQIEKEPTEVIKERLR